MEDNAQSNITRRTFLKTSAVGSLSLATHGLRAANLSKPVTGTSNAKPVVQTKAGKVRGFVSDGVSTFRGIPYGATTAGENRFMPPKAPGHWTGVRDASQYGPMAMQYVPQNPMYPIVLRGLVPEKPYNMSEDCLYLNVWTPELGVGHNRPVMVWLHPGGVIFWAGNSDWTDGTNLARHHDVVVVSLNHRLSAFGFLYLGDVAGPEYADSGNLGMLDIVAALQWVQENIAAFGGDPDNVTIFGESGGGWKVSSLLAMPSAQGLFHKSIIEFDVLIQGLSRNQASADTTTILGKLGIKNHAVEQLSRMTAEHLIETVKDFDFVPVVDGDVLPRAPFYPDAPSISSKIPLLIGTNMSEADFSVLSGEVPDFANDDALRIFLTSYLAGQGLDADGVKRLIEIYKRFHPSQSRLDVMVGAATTIFRDTARMAAELKARQAEAPVFLYEFEWQAPGFGGRYHACHTFELPFVFDNVDAASQLYGSNPDPRRYDLARNMSGAWAAYAHNGNPNHAGLPEWKPYSFRDRPTMIFNYSSKLVDDPHHDERLAIEQFRRTRVPRMTRA